MPVHSCEAAPVSDTSALASVVERISYKCGGSRALACFDTKSGKANTMNQKLHDGVGAPQKAPASTKPIRAEKSMKREANTAAENDAPRPEGEEPIDAGKSPPKKRGAPAGQGGRGC